MNHYLGKTNRGQATHSRREGVQTQVQNQHVRVKDQRLESTVAQGQRAGMAASKISRNSGGKRCG